MNEGRGMGTKVRLWKHWDRDSVHEEGAWGVCIDRRMLVAFP